MTQLEKLIHSLTTVIIRYHDYQSNVVKKIKETNEPLARIQTRDLAKSIFKNNETETLKTLITNSTPIGYDTRRALLLYMFNEIIFLQKLNDRKQPLNSSEFKQCINQISQLFINFKKLLNTKKWDKHTVKYSSLVNENESESETETEVSVELPGLATKSYISGPTLCQSGVLIQQEVLDGFHITSVHSDEQIQEIIEDLCLEFQNSLLIEELQKEKQKLTVLNDNQSHTVEELKKENQILTELNENQSHTIVLLNSVVPTTQSNPEELDSFKHYVEKKQIESFDSKELEVKTELQKIQDKSKKQETTSTIFKNMLPNKFFGKTNIYSGLFIQEILDMKKKNSEQNNTMEQSDPVSKITKN